MREEKHSFTSKWLRMDILKSSVALWVAGDVEGSGSSL